MNFKVLDLFCGAGGLSTGFEMANFEIVAGIDVEEVFLKTFKRSHSEALAIKEDLNKNEVKKLLLNNGIEPHEIDVVIGGPPCQGFSTVGNRMIDDPRNNLVKEFTRVISEIEPPMFLMENVPGLASMKNGIGKKIVDELLEVFDKLDYQTRYNILTAADYGVPQLRKRLFFIGIRKDLENDFSWPQKTHTPPDSLYCHSKQLNPYVTVREAISDLPPLSAGEEAQKFLTPPQNEYQRWARDGAERLTNHKVPNHSKQVIERIKHIPMGGNHSNLPDHLKLKSGYPNIYGRLKWDLPATTITANFGCASAPGRFIHPRDHRVLSVREGARLQSFPDRITFFGSLNQQYKQVGNAVPPLMAKALAESMKMTLKKVLR